MYGYNILLKLGATPKQLLAVTQDDFSLSAIIKESITKDDQGQTQRTVTGHDATFSVAGLATNETGNLVRLTRDEILELSLKKGSEAIIDFAYSFEGGHRHRKGHHHRIQRVLGGFGGSGPDLRAEPPDHGRPHLHSGIIAYGLHRAGGTQAACGGQLERL